MDRRKSSRYRMDQSVRYTITTPEGDVTRGTGTTVDFGGKGLSFRTEQALPIGASIEVAVDWPVDLNQECPLCVWAKGTVVRSAGGFTAVAISQHEFRTTRRKAKAKVTAGH